MSHGSFDSVRGATRARRSSALFSVAAAIGVVGLAPAVLSAQSYFAPLVTPPASVGTCTSPAYMTFGARRDTTPVSGRELLLMSTPPGNRREIQLLVEHGHPVLFDDVTFVTRRPGAMDDATIYARIDSVGNVRGWRDRATTALPDSVVQMHPDTASLRRVLHARARTTGVSRAALTAAEQLRVREMAAWLLRRCPA